MTDSTNPMTEFERQERLADKIANAFAEGREDFRREVLEALEVDHKPGNDGPFCTPADLCRMCEDRLIIENLP